MSSDLRIVMQGFFGLLFETIVERGGDPSEVLDEDPIIVEHTENLLCFLYHFRKRHDEYRFDFLSLRGETEARDVVTEELDVIVTEMTFLFLESETDLL